MTPFTYKLISLTSVTVGIISLITFFLLVLFGPLSIIQLNLSNIESLLLNSALSMIFFAQHSIMVRQTIQEKVKRKLPNDSFYAFHSIISGILLFGVCILWQKSPVIITTIIAPYSYLLFTLQFLSSAGLIWGIKSLKDFDPFGRKQISRHLTNRKQEQVNDFVYSGPYNFIRHPFYFFILVMIWSHPIISTDRVLFICLWTIWVIIGTLMEERDLVKQIGPKYREYQKKVPMLIPYKILSHWGK